MQEFYIKKGSLNPELRMELVNNGRYDFREFYEVIQDATITFSMFNVDNGVYKIINNPAILEPVDSCNEKFIIKYQWKERDVKGIGIFKGEFNINFNGNISQNGVTYPIGNLKFPIKEDLIITIKD